MTTEKQVAANKGNSKKSTGAKTPDGKAMVSMNAVRHGLLSHKVIIAGERAEDYEALLCGLIESLCPVGVLEQLLVEKIAVAFWKQKRLVAAESASIDLGQRMEQNFNQREVNMALALYNNFGNGMEMSDLTPHDVELLDWCRDVIAEYDALDDVVLDNDDLAQFERESPLMFEQFGKEAADNSIDIKTYTTGKLIALADELYSWCERYIARDSKKKAIQDVARQVQIRASAPVSNELLARYSTGLDNELYRAIEALRRQQEFRFKNGIVDEVEA